MLKINSRQIETTLVSLAKDNNVTVSQLASWIFVHYYKAITHLPVMKKIHRASVAIQHWSE